MPATGPATDDPTEGLLMRQGSKPSFYEDNPTYHSTAVDDHFWKLSTPEAQGLDEAVLKKATEALGRQPASFSLLIIRNGYLVLEKYFHGSDASCSNNVHSASKSILSALVGIALERGVLKGPDEPLSELLPGYRFKDTETASITLRNLLTMTSGFKWTEDETEYSIEKTPNWVQAILDLPLASAPGTKFNYCTGNTHILSAILTEASGQSTPDFATEMLFQPLGVGFEHWGADPQGIASGGYNFYVTPRVLARFAFMVYNGGTSGGRRIVPAGWLARSISPEGPGDSGYPYGYLYWLPKVSGHAVSKMWGFGGQFAYLIPDADMIVIMTHDTRRDYPEPNGDEFIEKHILPAIR
jgi:CubicO group peptidase (beta-lactamase class C family)